MRGIWSCCLVLAASFLGVETKSNLKRKLGSNHWDQVHEAIQAQKRDATECPQGYQLCPPSLKGGCCPADRSCGISSCYATTAAVQTACGIAGYSPCAIEDGGGCCPQSYSCFPNGCSPLPGVVFTETCGVNSYLCPASLGYGCCKNGMACGLNNCYSTDPTTFTLTETLTTTDATNRIHTITTTIVTATTPQPPTATATFLNAASTVSQMLITPPPIVKTKATGDSSSSGGLSKGAIGGIIAAAGIVLVGVIVATFFILRRLNQVMESNGNTKTPSGSRSKQRHEKPSYSSEIDAMSFDPLMIMGSDSTPSLRRPTHPVHPTAAYDPAQLGNHQVSPPLTTPFSPESIGVPFSPNDYQRGYRAVPNYDYSSTDPSPRHQPLQGYFDISPDLRDQNFQFGHISPPSPHNSSHHGRNMSDASDYSQQSAELDAGRDGSAGGASPTAATTIQRALSGLGLSRVLSRRKSSAGSVSSPGQPEWAPISPERLDHIPELTETTPTDTAEQYHDEHQHNEPGRDNQQDRHDENDERRGHHHGLSNAELRRMALESRPVRFKSGTSDGDLTS
ncbi:hypothetical protein F5884DRAFT_302535 [Xylogone sp. PMI_703]|nr:hypothetical protein F5884DRAFT_302535 [Xylogone sp. PMI_703]